MDPMVVTNIQEGTHVRAVHEQVHSISVSVYTRTQLQVEAWYTS
jgi:hypothetical protein